MELIGWSMLIGIKLLYWAIFWVLWVFFVPLYRLLSWPFRALHRRMA